MAATSDALHLLLPAAAGLALGGLFFGGLWWTVSQVASGRGGVWLLPVSSLLRTAGLLAGFWLVSRGDLMRLAACVGGWLVARWCMLRRFAPASKGGRPCT